MIDKSELPNGCDCDAAYAILYGHQESPGSFRGRFQRQDLTDDETTKVEDCATPEEAFAVLYPDYVSQHQFREEWQSEPVVEQATAIPEDTDSDEE